MEHPAPEKKSLLKKIRFLKNSIYKPLKILAMKLESNNLLKNLTASELKFLTAEVKETVAKDFKKERKRIFGIADLWNIQRRRKNILVKRRIF